MTDLLRMMNDNREADRWVGLKDWVGGRSRTWINRAYPGLAVYHCGHPTAIRPYYFDGEVRKYSHLADAQEAAIAAYQSRSSSGKPSSTKPK